MQTLQIALCEDSTEETGQLLAYIQESSISAQVSVFANGESFLAQFQPGIFDLILMDIYMGGMTGIEAVQKIRQADNEVPIAFTTVSLDHALDAYRLDVMKYIEKPATQKDIDDVLRLALHRKEQQPHTAVFLCGKSFSIPDSRLLYVEQAAHYLQFHYLGLQSEQKKGKLDDLEPQLNGALFYRCHKSYLVNLAFVTGIDPQMRLFYMKEGNPVYIRRENFNKAKHAWESWVFQDIRKGQRH